MILKKIKLIIKSKKFRPAISLFILTVTILVFINFFKDHPQYIKVLEHIKLAVIFQVIGLNVLLLIDLAFIYNFSLMLCGKKIPLKEQLLLTAYSSIANFFGPLQSGPGVRTVYLKTKHQIKARDYLLATLIGYAMFACISALFLIAGSEAWWQVILVTGLVLILSFGIIRIFMRRVESQAHEDSSFKLRLGPLIGLLVTTFIQVVLVTAYYFIELRVVDPHVALHQAITYSGAANFALFVSITPDAIGFREAFLVFTQRLHHISTAAIFSANVIDRGIYALFLLLIFAFVLFIHASDKLSISTKKKSQKDTFLK
jgi:uncharacterized membrane protein YbhN (UPF0104 family)